MKLTTVALVAVLFAFVSILPLSPIANATETMRNMAFAVFVTSSGYECGEVTHSFVRGVTDDGTVYIAVRCDDGREYMLMEGGEGSRIATCKPVAVLQTTHGLPASSALYPHLVLDKGPGESLLIQWIVVTGDRLGKGGSCRIPGVRGRWGRPTSGLSFDGPCVARSRTEKQ